MFVDKRRDALDDEQARHESGSTLARRLGGRLEQSKPWRALARNPPETARQIRPQELQRASHGDFTDDGAPGSPLDITTVLAPPRVDAEVVGTRAGACAAGWAPNLDGPCCRMARYDPCICAADASGRRHLCHDRGARARLPR